MTLPDVQFFLSRPSYPLGGTVVGTILIRKPKPSKSAATTATSSHEEEQPKEDDDELAADNDTISSSATQQKDEEPSLRDMLDSVTVHVAGFCKIDSRWHNVSDYIKIYGKIHPYILSLQDTFDMDLFVQSDDTVCFWATNGLEVLKLPERTVGRWEQSEEISRGDVLAFTVRIDIPNDLPHSVNATTCQYFYSANVLIKTKETKQQQVLKRNFLVTTDPYQTSIPPSIATSKRQQQSNNMIITSRVKFGTCVGMAHSNGLPCHLSSSEIHRPPGQMTVVQRDRNRAVQQDVQTIRVCNTHGQPACILTVIGTQTVTPDSQVHVIWDFPKSLDEDTDNNENNDKWIPCYQVSACIQGEEHAVFEDGSTKRTKSFLIDTCHEWIEHGITDRIFKTMLFSNNDTSSSTLEGTPCNLSTGIVEISMWIRVDVTIDGETNPNGVIEDYNNLTIQIPCRIRHNLINEDELLEEGEGRVMPLRELLDVEWKEGEFQTDDILSDLKILALQMESQIRNR